jgi:hypothetical protein
VSARDTARLLLAGVPTAREVDYHEWTATKPECRGELRAAGEVLWFTYAQDAPVRELPTEPGAVVVTSACTYLRDGVGDWVYVDSKGDFNYRHSNELAAMDWHAVALVADDEQGPVAALRRILDAVRGDDLGCVKKLQAVEFAAREALKRLDGGV